MGDEVRRAEPALRVVPEGDVRRPAPSSLNSQAPENFRNSHGPAIIFMATTFGGSTVMQIPPQPSIVVLAEREELCLVGR